MTEKLRLGISERSQILQCLKLNVSIDGLPISKSTGKQFWPILCSVIDAVDNSPFLVGLYCGHTKPDSPESFLVDFIEDAGMLLQSGLMYKGSHFRVSLNAFICDMPARAFIKGCIGHNGYYGCDKCTQKGVWYGRVVFPKLHCTQRTDSDF